MIRLAALSGILLIASGCMSDSEEKFSVASMVSPNQTQASQQSGSCGDVNQRPWCDVRLSPTERANLLIAVMTLSQKIGMLGGDDLISTFTATPYVGVVKGIPELGIPDLRMSDGPVGVRGGLTTSMPIPLSLGSTFMPELAKKTGQTVANEVKNKGNDLIHATVPDLARNPFAGRVFETFGEDPVLSAQMSREWIKGAQSEGVMANTKHYLMNHQEGQVGVPPLTSLVGGRSRVDHLVDERTLRELYLPPFEAAVVEGKSATIMCSYNSMNGSPTCANNFLINTILRGEWGFSGFIISDYIQSVKDTTNSIRVGTEIEMPIAVYYAEPLVQAALQRGEIEESDINARVFNIVSKLFEFGFFDRERYVADDSKIDIEAHAAVAREVAEEGTVLLSNNGALPIKASVKRIAIIGSSAVNRPSGGGSSATDPFRYVSPLDSIRQRAGSSVTVDYADGSDLDQARSLASAADLAIVFAADKSTEGMDKLCLRLDCSFADVLDPALLSNANADQFLNQILDPILTTPPFSLIGAPLLDALSRTPIKYPASVSDQNALIREVASVQNNTVVVLQTSGAVITPWRNQVNAVLQAWYSGQEGGKAIARILFGDVDPGGRLPLSFPDQETDNLVFGQPDRYPGLNNKVSHSEGVFIGYRWFDQQNITPAFPFGHGLSYTSFELSNMKVQTVGDDKLRIRVSLKNTGDRPGSSVVQLYLSLPSPRADVPQPKVVLKDFKKVKLPPNKVESLEFEVNPKQLSYWDPATKSWEIASGCYGVSVGFSSRDLPMQQKVDLQKGSCS
jgi:beta-glucosidase